MYFVTLSEMMGTDGEKIARQVAEKMGYRFYGEEELMRHAAEKGFLDDFKKMDEKGPPLFEKLFSERPKISLDRLQSVILEVARDGDAIFFGRGSQLLLRSFDCALHVLVIGSTEKRVERLAEQNKLGKELAEKMIQRSDHDKKSFLRFAFDEDWLNPYLYDLVLNTDKLSVDSAVKMVVDGAKSDGIKACGIDSVKLLGMLAMQRRVESVFLDSGVMSTHLFFNVEDSDTVRLYGFVNSSEEKEKIERIVKGIKDVKKVINEIGVMKGAMGGI
jgi:cytidylate kinase